MTPKLDTLQKIEIAEGVEIQLRLAGPLARGQAYFIDGLIKAGVWAAGSFALGICGVMITAAFGSSTGGGVTTGLLIVWGFLLEIGYPICFEVSRRGATPGKRMMGLRVARTSGAPITWHQSVVRNMLRMIDLLPVGGIAGVIACLSNDRFQRLGDLAADTVVIHADPVTMAQDGGASVEGIAPFRPGAALTREEQGAIVQFAERFSEWPEQRAEELAAHIQGLTRGEGAHGVVRILGMAKWIRGAG